MALSDQIQTIERALEGRKLSEFAREADLPYTTVRDWRDNKWCTSQVTTFDQLYRTAQRLTDTA